MRPLTTIELLDVWEMGRQYTLLEKAVQLLAVSGNKTPGYIASLSIGERDARLLQLREWLFGSRLFNRANCPQCAEPIEWEIDLGAIRLQTPGTEAAQEFTMDLDGFCIRFRLPTSYDLYRVTQPLLEANTLLTDCILDVKQNNTPYPVDRLPEVIIDALNQRMEAEDPQANIEMQVNCPACAHQWNVRFDIVSYLWAEIDNWAQHMFQDVYVLARAFGWSERDILLMSSQRRQHYVDMVRS